MGLFRRESTWDKTVGRVIEALPMNAVKSGAMAVGSVIGATLVSAAVSAARQRQEKP
jgi:hypothetical protein